MEKGTVTVIISLITLNILLCGCVENNNYMALELDEIPPILVFDKKDDFLLVITASPYINWSNVNIKNGECNLPSGYIRAGDMVTNCTGYLILVWIPNNTVIGEWNFGK
jgi:hypothetical protein